MNSFAITFFTGCIILLSCNQPESKTENRCMQKVIEQDSVLGSVRNNASKSISLSQTIHNYIKGIDTTDMSECPASFRNAFQNHMKAWEEMITVTDMYPQLTFPTGLPPQALPSKYKSRRGPVGKLHFLYYLPVMPAHTVIEKQSIYFITFTCHDWLPLIERSDGYGTVYNFFKVLNQKGNTVTGYVIMPNHVHFLLHYAGKEKKLNTHIGNGKRFMAYEMLKKLQSKKEEELLHRLKAAVQPKDAEKGQKHCFWKDSFEVKECRTEKFLLQKLHYMHNNPVSGKWNLSSSPLDYLHSSAPFYFNGRQQLFAVKDYRELLDCENMYE